MAAQVLLEGPKEHGAVVFVVRSQSRRYKHGGMDRYYVEATMLSRFAYEFTLCIIASDDERHDTSPRTWHVIVIN